MSIVELLSYVHSQGVRLWVEDDRLRYRAPREGLPPELRAQIAQSRAEIISFLRTATPLLPASSIERADRSEALPLSFAQQRLWFFAQMFPGSAVYNIRAALRLTGSLDCAALVRCLNRVVQRHEGLRTTFADVDGTPVQVIGAALRVALPVVDLRALPAAERETVARQLTDAEQRRPSGA